ncbi:MAG: TolC family protein [Burkholderiales bacterium]|nr:TolC family protein [Burkholderiales bacterium]
MRNLAFLGALAVVLGACTSFSPDGGMVEVRSLAQERIGQAVPVAGDAEAVRAAVDALLAKPLTADAAVEVALLNNPGLAARLAELGLAEADLVQAGRLRNPVFAYSNKRNSDITQIERTFLVNVAALVFMPLALDIEQRRFEQAKLGAALDIVSTAAAARQAYFRAVAAQEMLVYFRQVSESAEASSELARRMAQAGNWSRLAQMREQAFHADATAQLARAQQAAASEREQLTRVLGAASFTLAPRLPDLPAAPLAAIDAEQAALDRRLDVQIAKLDAESVAKSLGLTRATRFVNVLEVGYTNESETGERRKNGYEIELALPIFDWGDARVARAQTLYKQAMARTAAIAVNAQSEVRETYAAYRTAYDLAKHYRDEIVPLRRRIADENLLRYNGMLIGVFELLADAREQIGSVNAAIEATRDYWLAETALQLALAGKSPGSAMSAGSAASNARAPAPAGGH